MKPPAPWTIDARRQGKNAPPVIAATIYDRRHIEVAYIAINRNIEFNGAISPEEARAANLIRMAPDMLAALKECEPRIDEAALAGGRAVMGLLEDIRAILARAEMETI